MSLRITQIPTACVAVVLLLAIVPAAFTQVTCRRFVYNEAQQYPQIPA